MEIKITADGIYGNGPIKIGTVLNVKGKPPAGWAGKYVVVGDEPAPEAEPATGDKADTGGTGEPKPADRAAITKEIDEGGFDIDKRQSTEKLAAALAEAKAAE